MATEAEAYQGLVDRLASLFTEANGYFRIADAVSVEDNPVTQLDQGYGLAIGSGANTNRMQCGIITINRVFTVVLTRARDATDGDDQSRDTNLKSLLDDMRTVIASFEREIRLVDGEVNCKYVSDTGIESLSIDDETIWVTRINFEAETFDAP